ncbi:MAG: hypothetical protein JO306_11245 [Gemmatimonadetes bacterium]|nr:hypothetical protein [Gemmatimonadota bacterium]
MPITPPPHWYACYTRSRQEKIVDELLRQHKIESFLPVIVRESLWKDRKKQVSFPLFPGYVFARFTLDHLSQVLATHGVVAVVSARGYHVFASGPPTKGRVLPRDPSPPARAGEDGVRHQPRRPLLPRGRPADQARLRAGGPRHPERRQLPLEVELATAVAEPVAQDA